MGRGLIHEIRQLNFSDLNMISIVRKCKSLNEIYYPGNDHVSLREKIRVGKMSVNRSDVYKNIPYIGVRVPFYTHNLQLTFSNHLICHEDEISKRIAFDTDRNVEA